MLRKNRFLILGIAYIFCSCQVDNFKSYDVIDSFNNIYKDYYFISPIKIITDSNKLTVIDSKKEFEYPGYFITSPEYFSVNDFFIKNFKTQKYRLINTKRILTGDIDINFGTPVYINQKVLLVKLGRSIKLYSRNNNDYEKYFEYKFKDEIFNIFSNQQASKVLIEAGYFPAGGCEYVNYFEFNLHNHSIKEITDKLKPINGLSHPIEDFYYDRNQKYLFIKSQKMLNYNLTDFDDYILDSDFNIVGRALSKKYNSKGYEKNDLGKYEFYFWENMSSDPKIICFPVNYNFERQIYKTFYDSLLVKSDIEHFSKTEIELLKGTILIKNDGHIENEKIRDILSVYAFSGKYNDYKTDKEIETEIKGYEKQNFELLKSLR